MQNSNNRVAFTEDMKKNYTILVPNMLPIQFGLVLKIMKNYGYNMELLATDGQAVVESGLKNVHNDTCYPALLTIGQLMHAIESGKYDTNKLAVIMSQTGGGCRASNYIHLLRKALQKSGYEHIPVISLNFSGLEDNPGFKLTPQMLIQIAYGLLIGDLIMMLYNQCRPYEKVRGAAQKAVDICTRTVSEHFTGNRLIRYREIKDLYQFVLDAFSKVPCDTSVKKKKVGIVGEIYVKFSPLGNNHLEDFLVSEGCEPVLPGLLDFCLYCIYNNVIDYELYGRSMKTAVMSRFIYKFVLNKQKDMIALIEKHGRFRAPQPFEHVRKLSEEIIGQGVKMGEGWLLPAEMVELITEGVQNIVCAQPFGCLPNHIAGKGMVRKIREKYPEANIVSVDYDPGASKINQENRIKLMLSTAK